MEPSSQGVPAAPAPIPLSPAAFLLEIRRRRADLAEALRSNSPNPTLISPVSSNSPNNAPGASATASSAGDSAAFVRWLQRIDERLGVIDTRMTRFENIISEGSFQGISNDAQQQQQQQQQDYLRRLASDLQRQRSAYYQMLTTSEVVISKLVRENSDLKDRLNLLEQDDFAATARVCFFQETRFAEFSGPFF